MGSIATPDFDSGMEGTGLDGAVLVVEDGRRLSRAVGYMCDYLGVPMRRVGTEVNLEPLLRGSSPLGVICALEGAGQDGCHVMKTLAAHDRGMPLLMVTGRDPAMIGAAQAVAEACALTHLRTLQDEPGMGDVVEFVLGCPGFAHGDVAAAPQASIGLMSRRDRTYRVFVGQGQMRGAMADA